MPTLLKKLGISSPYHAAELERDLGIRFDDFTPEDSDTWKRQTLYLYQYAQTRTVTHAARTAGVTVSTAESWLSDNTLGFNQRLRISVLEYTDDMEVLFLERTRQPDSPTSFMTTLLRAQMPEKYGPARRSSPQRDNHCNCDHDSEHKPAAQHDNDQVALADIQRKLEQLQHLTAGIERDSAPQENDSDLSPTAAETTHSNLAPTKGETQRGGSHPTPNTHDLNEDTQPDLSPTRLTGVGKCGVSYECQSTNPLSLEGEGWGEGEEHEYIPLSAPTGGETTHSNLSPTEGETQRGDSSPQRPTPSAQNLNRRQRRELQRKHAPYPDTGAKRKHQKSHRARAPGALTPPAPCATFTSIQPQSGGVE